TDMALHLPMELRGVSEAVVFGECPVCWAPDLRALYRWEPVQWGCRACMLECRRMATVLLSREDAIAHMRKRRRTAVDHLHGYQHGDVSSLSCEVALGSGCMRRSPDSGRMLRLPRMERYF